METLNFPSKRTNNASPFESGIKGQKVKQSFLDSKKTTPTTIRNQQPSAPETKTLFIIGRLQNRNTDINNSFTITNYNDVYTLMN